MRISASEEQAARDIADALTRNGLPFERLPDTVEEIEDLIRNVLGDLAPLVAEELASAISL